MLSIQNLNAAYNGIQALKGVSMTIAEGEMVALIGPNGAGKSTLLNCISGVVRAVGTVRFAGHQIADEVPWKISRRGLLQVPEGRQVWPDMSVLENLQLGATGLAGRPATYSLGDVLALFPVLAERSGLPAGSLSGGQQQMLAIGRALMGAPRLLLLDEPSLGLSPIVVKQVFDVLRRLNADGLTILLVEQNARQALEVSNRAYVIEQGRIVQEGQSSQLANDPLVIAHYLGQLGQGEPGDA